MSDDKKELTYGEWYAKYIKQYSCPIIATQSDDDYKKDEEYWASMWPHVVGNQDIRRPGEKVKTKMHEATEWALKHFGITVGNLGKGKGGPKDPDCTIHDWAPYEGFSDNYDYCTKCDLKRTVVDD